MTTADPAETAPGGPPGVNYLNCASGIMSWLGTLDHKRIGIMYLVSVLTSFFLAGMLALVIRTELIWPGRTIIDQDTYNQIFTLHGAIMIFLVIIPSVPASLGRKRNAAWPSWRLLERCWRPAAIAPVSASMSSPGPRAWRSRDSYPSSPPSPTDGQPRPG